MKKILLVFQLDTFKVVNSENIDYNEFVDKMEEMGYETRRSDILANNFGTIIKQDDCIKVLELLGKFNFIVTSAKLTES